MAEFTAGFETVAPTEAALAYVSDLANMSVWDPSVREIARSGDERGSGIGARYTATTGFYGKAITLEYEVVELGPDGIAYRFSAERVQGRGEIALAATPSGSKVGYRLEARLGRFGRVLDRGLGVALAGMGDNAVAGLREQLDALV